MVLSKLAIGLIAGIGSIVAVGGITAGVVVSRNNTVVEATNETDESNSKKTNEANRSFNKNEPSLMENRNRNDSGDIRTSTTEMEDSKMQPMNQDELSKKEQMAKTGSQSKPVQVDEAAGSSEDNSLSTHTENQEQDEANTRVQKDNPKEMGIQPSLSGSSDGDSSITGQTEHLNTQSAAEKGKERGEEEASRQVNS